jgi:hypothetical protein
MIHYGTLELALESSNTKEMANTGYGLHSRGRAFAFERGPESEGNVSRVNYLYIVLDRKNSMGQGIPLNPNHKGDYASSQAQASPMGDEQARA